MKIHVIRHAQTDTNKQGIMGDIEEDINETGIMQCHEVAQKIAYCNTCWNRIRILLQ